MLEGSLDHQEKGQVLSVHVAGEFWGQQQPPAPFRATQEMSRRQRWASKVSTRRTLKHSPPGLHMLTLVFPLIHLSFFLQTSLISLEWELGVEVIKGYWSI